MHVYPYKTINSGRFTKYTIAIVEDGSVLIEYYFKGRRKAQIHCKDQKSINIANVSKDVKTSAKWALYEAESLRRILK